MTTQPTVVEPPAGVIPADIAKQLPEAVLRQAVASARDGICISDARRPDMPLVYVNPAFERMTGYRADQVLGLNCRFLQGDETLQPQVGKLRRALDRGSACVVTLRNYRRDGKLFYNELSLAPVRDADGTLTHYIGIQKDVTRRVRAEQRLRQRDRELVRLNAELERLARRDGLTGLLNRRSFDDCLSREWRRALREGGTINLFMIDIDHFKALNDSFGHGVGDACLRRCALTLEECFGRASDFVARYGGEEFVVLNAGMSPDEARAQGEHLLESVRSMQLPAPVEQLTVSVGVASSTPSAAITADALMQAADAALYAAKNAGRDRVEVGQIDA